MLIIQTTNTDPYFNLASEQYLLDNCDETVFMLWRNDKAVIIGKNQNAYSEINENFVRENDIKVVRRLTGGGAVFHDLGNVNFTFIEPKGNCEGLDFAKYTKPIIDALHTLGANAELSGRNDITIDGFKVSGNAQCVYNNKVMHHGTLLYSADMSKIAGSLNVDPEKIASKGIKSVRSRVANINTFIDRKMDVVEFLNYIEEFIPGTKRSFTPEEIQGIEKLKHEKYSTWEWNYGKSKEFQIRNKSYFPYGLIDIQLNVEKGIIRTIRINGDYFGVKDISELEDALVGIKYHYDDIAGVLSNINIDNYIHCSDKAEIIELILKN